MLLPGAALLLLGAALLLPGAALQGSTLALKSCRCVGWLSFDRGPPFPALVHCQAEQENSEASVSALLCLALIVLCHAFLKNLAVICARSGLSKQQMTIAPHSPLLPSCQDGCPKSSNTQVACPRYAHTQFKCVYKERNKWVYRCGESSSYKRFSADTIEDLLAMLANADIKLRKRRRDDQAQDKIGQKKLKTEPGTARVKAEIASLGCQAAATEEVDAEVASPGGQAREAAGLQAPPAVPADLFSPETPHANSGSAGAPLEPALQNSGACLVQVVVSQDVLLDEACQLLASLLQGWSVQLDCYEQLRLFAALAGFRRKLPAPDPTRLHNRRALLAALCAVAAFFEGLCRLDDGCGKHDCGDEWRLRCKATVKAALLLNGRPVTNSMITDVFEKAICFIHNCVGKEVGTASVQCLKA